MATSTQADTIPELKDGDRLSVAEFERRYEAAPHIKKAELIEGVVYVVPSVTDDHAVTHFDLGGWIAFYRMFTPRVIGASDGSVRLDNRNEVQPDVHLRIPTELGGQATLNANRRVEGSPELVAEVAVSTVARDLGVKLEAYRRNGVREAIVWRALDKAIDWFILRDGQYQRIEPDADGLLKSEVFPGLWLDPAALIRGDLPAVFGVVQQGAATPEHAAFVRRLLAQGTEE